MGEERRIEERQPVAAGRRGYRPIQSEGKFETPQRAASGEQNRP